MNIQGELRSEATPETIDQPVTLLEALSHECDFLRGLIKNLEFEKKELYAALSDLSFECDGVVYVKAPTRETYNRTFAVVKKYRLPSVSTEVLLEPTRGGPQMSAPSEQ